MSHTLVLNADAQPVSVLPLSVETWKEAIKLVFIDRAEVIHHYEKWEVHSPSVTLQVPSIIMLKEYVKLPKSVTYCRENILIRDEFRCQYCGADYHTHHTDLTLDHVIPRYHGGPTNFGNIVAACPSCNLEKSHFLKMKPAIKPKRPTYYELVKKRKKFPLHISHESWIPYLGWDETKLVINSFI